MFSFTRIFYANTNAFRRRAYDNLLQVLQSSVRSQLAGLNDRRNYCSTEPPAKEHKFRQLAARLKGMAHKMNTTFGPIEEYLEVAENTLEMQENKHKIWLTGQYRNLALAARLLQKKEIIAVPTDTVYGFACLATDTDCIKKLYEIKGRDFTKPLAICLSRVEDISIYGVVNTDISRIIRELLPGPYTIILKRTEHVNPDLNPGHDSIGIRVPANWFIRNVVHIAGPIALTSANKSGDPSCISIMEFSDLWLKLGGIFHDPYTRSKEHSRKGSTVIDLSVPEEYKIVRAGIGYKYVVKYLENKGLTKSASVENKQLKVAL